MALPLRAEPEPRLADTAVRVVEAGQRVLLARLDLARLDALRLLSLGVHTAVAMAAATILLSGAWCAVVIAVALQLQSGVAWSLPASLTLVALVSAAAGVVLLALALRRVGGFALSAIGPVRDP
jgi:hypothetical protein